MKKTIYGLLLAIPLMVGAATNQQPSQVVPAQNAEEVRQNIKELAQLFGVETPNAGTQVQTNPPQQHKTMGDVMDKAVDKISDVVGAMSQAISKVAPDVWRIMIRQQYAKALGRVVPWLGAVVVFWILSRSFKKWFERVSKDTENDKDARCPEGAVTEYEVAICFRYGSLVIVTILSLIFCYMLTTAIQLMINPEFYAIQDLLNMILNRTMDVS